jgi:hypothetical protein
LLALLSLAVDILCAHHIRVFVCYTSDTAMKSTLLLYASLASFYVLAAPESKAEPEALPEPQLPFLPLLLGLPLIIGTLGSIAAKEGRNGGGGKCECPSTQRCSASKVRIKPGESGIGMLTLECLV